MKAKVLNLEGVAGKDVQLPKQFDTEYRPDLIKRAVLSLQSHNRQPYGAKTDAGLRASAELSRRRRKYRGSYGKGISRVPRKIMSARGSQFNWTGAVAPGTVGGRRAHPPKSIKEWALKINVKERKKALISAIAATANKELVLERGHKAPENIPLIIDNSFEKLSKTKDVIKTLEKLGLKEELERTKEKKVRAGKGKNRGRRYRKKKGPLLVVSDKCALEKAAAAIPGIDIVVVKSLNTELLAPGAVAGRLTAWTIGAIEKMGKEKLFI
ncbi:MAG: 50S ribosomal protein L4 [Nanoarchaeota archaeon]|nr:50S ribosomal protein L4 [Nanoarchaeota archaeon]MBU4352478.1 50S ribosomal protein L4 [Nanoarchaeota archaeon]MBU4455993.1 50S ribosomal protein L4 [Nanoarchaeota archaeon]MCG2719412.1 50S ribosomal protein L4 [Nanoarchaeota archaeon]